MMWITYLGFALIIIGGIFMGNGLGWSRVPLADYAAYGAEYAKTHIQSAWFVIILSGAAAVIGFLVLIIGAQRERYHEKTVCPNCGAMVSRRYRYCPECGAASLRGKETEQEDDK